MKRGFLNSTKGKKAITVQSPHEAPHIEASHVREVNSEPQSPSVPSPSSFPVARKDEKDTNEEAKASKKEQSAEKSHDYKNDQRILHHLGPVPNSPEKSVWTANQIIEDAPSNMLDYEPQELVCTTIPAQLKNATRESNPHGWTECLLTGLMKQTILQTPTFPQPLSQPGHPRHRVGKSSAYKSSILKPLPGLYAIKELNMGNLILSERPVLIVPAMMRVGEVFSEVLSQMHAHDKIAAAMSQWQKALEAVFNRLLMEDQEEFWKLRDIHQKYGKKSIDGIMKTNGFSISGLADPGLKDDLGAYSGVCLVLSQLNHSCRPNVERFWHMPSFSFQLRATRKIAKNEELTISYIDQLEPYAERCKALKLFDIVCSCQSCKKPKIGDRRRAQFLTGTPTTDDFGKWVKDATVSGDHLIKRALVQISLLEDDGLENSPYYQNNLMIIMLCYVALGDGEKAMRWGKKLGKSELCKLGPEVGDQYEKLERYTKHQLWKLRVNAENTYKSTLYSMNEKMK